MNTYVVTHEWNTEDTEAGNSIVGRLIEKSRTNQLPDGVSLLGVMVSSSSLKAICVWEAERSDIIEEIIRSIRAPTRHAIAEYKAIYGLSKI